MKLKGELQAKVTTRVKKYNDGDMSKEPVVEEKTFLIHQDRLKKLLKGSD